MAKTPIAIQAGGDGVSPSPSKSRSITETVNGSHHFTIQGYSLAKGMGVGKYIASDTFSVGGFDWAIYFYPDGKNAEDNSQYVSVFIALASDGTDVRALFELTLLDQSGKGKHKVHSHFDRALESGPYTLKYRGSMWGYKRFFRRLVLEQSDFLKQDSLAITCTVGVVKSSTQGPKPYSIHVPPPNLGMNLEFLLETGEGSDVVFDVDSEQFIAHKLVLAARSPVFKALLLGPMREKGSMLPVDDIQAPVFKAMLHFIYTDTIPALAAEGSSGPGQTGGVWGAGPSSTGGDRLGGGAVGSGGGGGGGNGNNGPPSGGASAAAVMAQHLLAAADRFGLDRLRLMCESRLCEDVTVDTVATTLALAEQHHAAELKAVCLKFAAANLAAVMQSEGFQHLKDSCPSLQAELLRTVAGVEDEGLGASHSRSRVPGLSSSWGGQLDGADPNGRRVRQKT